MFPEHIDAGHILIIAGNEYAIVSRMPDAFFARSLDAGSHTETFEFAELIEIQREGMLRIGAPRTEARSSAPVDDDLWRVVCLEFLRLESLGLASRSTTSIQRVMPRLVEAQERYMKRRGEERSGSAGRGPLHPSPATLRRRVRRHESPCVATLSRPNPVRHNPFAEFHPAVREITRKLALMTLDIPRPQMTVLYGLLHARIHEFMSSEGADCRELLIPPRRTFVNAVRAIREDCGDQATRRRYGSTPGRLAAVAGAKD